MMNPKKLQFVLFGTVSLASTTLFALAGSTDAGVQTATTSPEIFLRQVQDSDFDQSLAKLSYKKVADYKNQPIQEAFGELFKLDCGFNETMRERTIECLPSGAKDQQALQLSRLLKFSRRAKQLVGALRASETVRIDPWATEAEEKVRILESMTQLEAGSKDALGAVLRRPNEVPSFDFSELKTTREEEKLLAAYFGALSVQACPSIVQKNEDLPHSGSWEKVENLVRERSGKDGDYRAEFVKYMQEKLGNSVKVSVANPQSDFGYMLKCPCLYFKITRGDREFVFTYEGGTRPISNCHHLN